MPYVAVGLSVVFAVVALLALAAVAVGGVLVLVKLVRLVLGGEAVPPVPPPRLRTAVAAGAPQQPRPVRAAPAAAPPALPEPSPRQAREELAAWRYRQLLRLGVEPLAAAGAALAEIDVARVRTLVERGCPPGLALELAEP